MSSWYFDVAERRQLTSGDKPSRKTLLIEKHDEAVDTRTDLLRTEKEITQRRASTPKVKTSCKHCRIIKARCDEKRPQCQTCAKYGRICDIDDEYVARPEKAITPSCYSCRIRKQRCDKTRPQCQTCVKYGRRCNIDDEYVVRPEKAIRPGDANTDKECQSTSTSFQVLASGSRDQTVQVLDTATEVTSIRDLLSPLSKQLPYQEESKPGDVRSWLLLTRGSSVSSVSDSVGSLDLNIAESSEDDELALLQASSAESFSSADLLTSFSPVFERIPIDVASKLERLLTSWFAKTEYTRAAASSETPSSTDDPLHCTLRTSLSSNTQKRGLSDNDSDFPERGDKDDRKRRKTSFIDSSDIDNKKWACPCYQKEPHRYCVETELGDWRKCAKSSGFKEVHRVNY
ncbi:hypothetical protein BP6252_08142 [Coleophoma cylindrospora]|uniref:Zn(2)-C6 fungal-type domain-containing protein n=1 Tax=Coleophoma cylindrospora TaxID=1849047 RepID=A0A3D8RBZ5_9HELO|nr:hypothetical protein BP6252_08142 [Coleophoma cylindrospora]